MRPWPSWTARALSVASATWLIALALLPPAWVEHGPSFCLVKAVTGHACLGCGMTRAFSAALHGHLAAAFALNHLIVIALPAIVVFACAPGVFTPRRAATPVVRPS